MCSINGVSDFLSDRLDLTAVEEMGKLMSHRGPDQNGWTSGNGYVFYHNRLAVIDVENGQQPMQNDYNGVNYCIVYNGELYNTCELRSELEAKGHRFKTQSDTEVLLKSYIQWGTHCVHKLNGIFAFAVYDGKCNSIFAARDRLGVKPFFYTVKNSAFIFASEIKAILKHPDVQPFIDQEGIWQLIYLSPTRLPDSGIFKDIYELAPACCAVFDRNGLRLNKYWELETHEHPDDLQTTILHTRDLIFNSIRRQLVSDVPLCTFLSGGLDSSIISSVASMYCKERSEQLSTYSFEYEDNDKFFKPTAFQPQSDTEFAKYAAGIFKTKHTVLKITPRLCADLLFDAVKHRDLPGMADIDSSLLYYCRQVKKRHTVAVSGECADEIFGGYPWFHNGSMLTSNTFPWIHSLDIRSQIFTDEFAQHDRGVEYINDIFSQYKNNCLPFKNEGTDEYNKRLSCYLSVCFFMTSLLERKDRMSMASGLEVRVPFADHRIIEYIYNVPWNFKYKESTEKYLLRKAAHDILPKKILYRKKSPYPKTHNPDYGNIVVDILKHRMAQNDSILNRIVNRYALNKLFNSENITWFGQLMGRPQLIAYLIQLDIWFKHYKVCII